ncbi:MAG: hypothetical protein JW712_08290 [Dehalococcoidales bacterium]|nr:hypothetical protein [Dehalococcoidales bacterium]
MDTECLLQELAGYTAVLAENAAKTNYANDRPSYEKHLAMAARMFVAIQYNNSLEELQKLLQTEISSDGWDYLQGEFGNTTEKAFCEFAAVIEEIIPESQS